MRAILVNERSLVILRRPYEAGRHKAKILDKALALFSSRGYDAVSVGEIAQAVGIKAPSLYNYFPSKQAIFDALVESVAAQYTRDTDQISIHVQNAPQDIPVSTAITEDALYEKVPGKFSSIRSTTRPSAASAAVTIEQFRSPELSRLYTERYITRVVRYHAVLFESLIAAGEIRHENPQTLALLYVSPVITLLGICDREPNRRPRA